MKWYWAVVVFLLVLAGCTSAPSGITPVQGFELDRYLGTWYEVARLDHSFERGLSGVSAQYTLGEDGGVRVINRGIDSAGGEASQAEGRAYFVGDSNTGHLKVSFFGPFYGAYVVFELDPDYQYAFVSGYSRDYLWLLSRTPQVPASVMQAFRSRATELGFDLSGLIVSQPDDGGP
ncbi:apolipoprotein D and lipocalin family protein [Ferrimonas sediminum]|uniref:Outer membrane lipoprotein Blc n=1 Tax=Ferrimonas sediminum TaxID=718193 RepID=A0A1G8X2S5_9GAMM|nr:lipocalin family protein [Ferrimonas sediminum]SDJ84754.1 apolipoprotein D and lipocalin family protein [Ferrimonas sediminum]